ncbi:MAG: preprotein translocase subunit SecA [Parcubacteria group bacterium Gr01-1014_44]|nr:MAG: preprotein translocase subunit SecA [Parcubacteria group bacterium Gr01-1014_44]
MSFLNKIFGDANLRIISRLQPIAEEVGSYEKEFTELSEGELKSKTSKFKERLSEGASLADLLPEAFALVREAARRTIGQRHFDVQLIGGMVLNDGKIAEMKTGEGKTLVATLPLYLNSLSGKGAHLVTPNDYLSRVGGGWMGPVYHALGVSVGVIAHDFSGIYDPDWIDAHDHGDWRLNHWRPCMRREAYASDITYGTNNEFGFDYLRDNLAYGQDQISQRGYNFAIVDEIDSILIDEARTPLIISSPDADSADLYQVFSRVIPRLERDKDYNVDEKMKAVTITETGIDKVESALGIKDIYSEGGIRYVHHLEQALRAEALFHLDKEYVVKDGAVIIVDEFTGRLMPGRRWSDGLHQAVEAKEGVAVQKESRTVASITFQNYFRMYEKLAGMTGTAQTSAEEFHKVYKLDVVSIPTNQPLIRKDYSDRIYQTSSGRFKAVVDETRTRHQKGQPVLIGTVSIEKNELVSAMLKKEGISHEVLNAKNHEREAQIISQAGKIGAVTVATNMAGRGVDIILGGTPYTAEEHKKIQELGGLLVLGTSRHEARRIDNQLRGRSGRQGDPGETRFFVSLDDDIMRIFGSDRIKNMMGTFGIPEDEPIEHKLVSKALESAQAKIEGFNFDARKHLLDYDDVLNRQRKAVYERRKKFLFAAPAEMKKEIYTLVEEEVDAFFDFHTAGVRDDWDTPEIFENMRARFGVSEDIKQKLSDIANSPKDTNEAREELREFLHDIWEDGLDGRINEIGEEGFSNLMRVYVLQIIDTLWTNHLEAMDYMRSSVGLRAYGQRDPLVEYKNEGARMFKEMQSALKTHLSHIVLRVGVNAPIKEQKLETKHADARIIGDSKQQMNSAAASTLSKTVGRNDPCPCGSGKKYKRCHGA